MRSHALRLLGTLGLALCTICLVAPQARAQEEPLDEVTVKGQTLKGKVIGLGRRGLEFTTIYGEGKLTIPYDSIEQLTTERSFWVLHGDDEVLRGRLLGVQEKALLVGDSQESAEPVAFASIKSAVSTESYEGSWLTRVRARYPFWKGSVDVGTDLETGAVDKVKVAGGIYLERRAEPTRFEFDVRAAYETQQKRDEARTTTKDEFRIFLTGEYTIHGRIFAYGIPAAERDKPRRINIRAFPSAGLGYRFFDSRNVRLQLQAGVGYVNEDFERFRNNDYVALHLGGSGEYRFQNGVWTRLFVFYLPQAFAPSENWLFRSEFELTVPIYDPLAFRWRITQVNDNNPGPNVGNNKTVTTLGFALEF